MKTFNSMIPNYANCIRNGELHEETPVRNLVRGDIVRVKAGDIIPADIRVIDSKGFKVCLTSQIIFIILIFSLKSSPFKSAIQNVVLQVDNSSLTGESVAVPRSNVEGIANILESPNVAFFSTMCVEGWALGNFTFILAFGI